MFAERTITLMEGFEMSEQQVFENLRELRLNGMVEALQKVALSPDMMSMSLIDNLAFLTCEEIQYKAQKKRERLLRRSKLKHTQACVEDIDYVAGRGIDKSQLQALYSCDWVVRNQFISFTGPAGTGKTWLTCALANQAIRLGYPVLYKRFGLLMEELDIARRDGSLPKVRNQLSKYKLLIWDDWAMSPLIGFNRQDLLEILEDRIESGSLIITSQLPMSKWHEYIGEPTIADAIMDRIVHRTHHIQLSGESMRKRYGLQEDKS